ncbi:MAG: hypothetical protein GXO86_06645 [Chlorobi bacterium]|nr:hypothetical protein [Chlorobiota bacterium]
MNKKTLTLSAIVFMALIISFTGCKKSDDSPGEKTSPTMTNLQVSSDAGQFQVTVTFNEAVYKNAGAVGNLDNSSFKVTLEGGVAGLKEYTVSHTAGDAVATISLQLNGTSNGKEVVFISPAGSASIFNGQGVAMSSNETMYVNLISTVTITDSGDGTGTTTWTSDNVYILDGFVFVNTGQTLTIEPGTIIKGKAGQGENASALIVARGGKIIAKGTSERPIIFTAEADDLQGAVPDLDNGLWGGVIILGKARLNTDPATQQIEGIPTTEPRGEYGGNDDNDNSGVLKYVSIRHGGTEIGEGNEINGLTLGAVGSGTVIEYIEIFSNKDDGIEFFGGAPRLNNIVVAFCGDDCYDYDQGFRGYGQFWLAVQGYGRGDRVGEHDGGTDPETGQPYAIPQIFNVTYVGRGNGAGKRLVTFRDNAGGHYANSVLVNQDKGVDIELLTGESSNTRFQNGDLTLENNIFWSVGQNPVFNISAADDVPSGDIATAAQAVADYFAIAGNLIQDPGIEINEELSLFNPVPTGDVGGKMATVPDSWFKTTDYKGAFDPAGENWAAGWTLFSKYMSK